MMRQTYETEKDRAAELEIADCFGQRYGYQVVKRGVFDHYDFDALKGSGVVGHFECKRRYNPMSRYADFLISMIKVNAAKTKTLPCVIVVQWDDCIGWVRPERVAYTKMGGRSDRDDPADRELMAHFRLDDFYKINRGETTEGSGGPSSDAVADIRQSRDEAGEA